MTRSFSDLLREARAEIREVSPAEVDLLLEGASPPILVDVREEFEWEQGHITGAVHVAKSYLEQGIESDVPDRSRPVVLYCKNGIRALRAKPILRQLGFVDVMNIGPMSSW